MYVNAALTVKCSLGRIAVSISTPVVSAFGTLNVWNCAPVNSRTWKFLNSSTERSNVQGDRIVEEFGFQTNFVSIDFFRQEARISAASRSRGIKVETARFITVRKAGIDIDRIGKCIAHLTGVDQLIVAKLAEGPWQREYGCRGKSAGAVKAKQPVPNTLEISGAGTLPAPIDARIAGHSGLLLLP